MISKNYYVKKSPIKRIKNQQTVLEHAINMEAKHIAKNIKLDDRIKNLAKTSAFITSLEINQWKDTYNVVNWFNAVKDKNPNVVLFS